MRQSTVQIFNNSRQAGTSTLQLRTRIRIVLLLLLGLLLLSLQLPIGQTMARKSFESNTNLLVHLLCGQGGE